METKHSAEPEAGRGGRLRRNWKRAAVAGVMAFVVLSVGRSVPRALGIHVPGRARPAATGSTTREITAQQRGSDKVAKADATLAQGTAQAKISAAAARPGDSVSLSASGFASGEDLAVYWGRVTGDPSTVLHADGGGSVSK